MFLWVLNGLTLIYSMSFMLTHCVTAYNSKQIVYCLKAVVDQKHFSLDVVFFVSKLNCKKFDNTLWAHFYCSLVIDAFPLYNYFNKVVNLCIKYTARQQFLYWLLPKLTLSLFILLLVWRSQGLVFTTLRKCLQLFTPISTWSKMFNESMYLLCSNDVFCLTRFVRCF